MSKKETITKINTEENEKIKTQIDASIGIARSLINSWLPAPKPGEKIGDDEDDLTMTQYSTGRPDRLGLGAKFLSHNDAMRHNNSSNNGGMASKEELQLKNKILNQNRRAATHHEINTPIPIGKRFRPQDNNNDSESDNEEESRSTTFGTKQSKNKKKKGNNNAASTSATPPAASNNKANNNAPSGGGKKKIGNQGDFLSMYLTERAGKKKNKK